MSERSIDSQDRAAVNIASLYNTFASEFDRDRIKNLMESSWLSEVLTRLHGGTSVLDVGCGSGEPIARFFIHAGCHVTGIDIAPRLLEMCRMRFPHGWWIHCDMRSMALRHHFNAIIAWDSLFHLPAEDQRKTFEVLQKHIAPQGLLLFTSGHQEGISMGKMYGHDLFHASLNTEEYQSLLATNGFEVLRHCIEDPECGEHTVWLARQCAL